jgi:protocatechuate 3,4-dioxygenase beta subunit
MAVPRKSPLVPALVLAALVALVAVAWHLLGQGEEGLVAPGSGVPVPALERPAAETPQAPRGTSEGPAPIPTRSFLEQASARTRLGAEAGSGSVIEGRVVAPDGGAVEAAQVQLILDVSTMNNRTQDGDVLGRVLTDAGGWFRFEGLASHESYIVQAGHADYTSERRGPIEFGMDRVVSIELALRAGLEITGTVTDTSGRPVPGARIAVMDLQAMTREGEPAEEREGEAGPDGRYRVRHLREGLKRVVARASGLATDGRNGIHLVAGQPAPVVDLVLEEGFRIRGVVVDSETQAPVPGALLLARVLTRLVKATPETGEATSHPDQASEDELATREVLREKAAREAAAGAGAGARLPMVAGTPERPFILEPARSRDDGSFELGGLISARYQITVKAPGYQSLAGYVADAGSEGLRIPLARSARIAGRVVDGVSGAPVTNFTLGLVITPGPQVIAHELQQRFRTEDGSFEFLDARPGTWYLSLTAEGYAGGLSDPLTLQQGQQISGLTILALRGMTVRGRVLDPDGRPVSSARVVAEAASRDATPPHAFALVIQRTLRTSARLRSYTDAGGHFHLEALMPGAWRIQVEAPGLSPAATPEFTGREGEEVVLQDIRLSRGARIFGIVRKADGTPDDQATVVVAPQDPALGFPLTLPTDSEGRYEATGLKPGSYKVQATQREGKFRFEEILRMHQTGPVYSVADGQALEVDF